MNPGSFAGQNLFFKRNADVNHLIVDLVVTLLIKAFMGIQLDRAREIQNSGQPSGMIDMMMTDDNSL
ncbi:hypothetical protein SDC9_133931 [bioreactor metagenome]|uniref:Uncharacterized protein n=1 Tax=bioreactor metagenome TaxID=1076179 RepID=A0A645DC97_9ZZZZ